MLSSLRNIFRVPDLRNKILFTLLMLAAVPARAPTSRSRASTSARSRTLQEQAEQGGVLGFLQLFSGGALTQFAVFALGIMPYITASIIMQILAVVIPKLEQWQKQGAVGQRKITQWTRYLTVAIAVMQATGLAFLFHNGGGGFTAATPPALDLFARNFNVGRVAARRAHPHRRHRAAHVDGRAHHPAGHRQRHVAADLRLGGQPRCPANFGAVQAENGTVVMVGIVLLFIGDAGGHRVRRAGPAPDPRAVRQARGRPAHVRRPEHLHPAQGQPAPA